MFLCLHKKSCNFSSFPVNQFKFDIQIYILPFLECELYFKLMYHKFKIHSRPGRLARQDNNDKPNMFYPCELYADKHLPNITMWTLNTWKYQHNMRWHHVSIRTIIWTTLTDVYTLVLYTPEFIYTTTIHYFYNNDVLLIITCIMYCNIYIYRNKIRYKICYTICKTIKLYTKATPSKPLKHKHNQKHKGFVSQQITYLSQSKSDPIWSKPFGK